MLNFPKKKTAHAASFVCNFFVAMHFEPSIFVSGEKTEVSYYYLGIDTTNSREYMRLSAKEYPDRPLPAQQHLACFECGEIVGIGNSFFSEVEIQQYGLVDNPRVRTLMMTSNAYNNKRD